MEPPSCTHCGAPHARFLCGRCRLAAYCSVRCQSRDYKRRHRAACHASAREATLEAVLRLCAGGGDAREGSVLGFLWQDEALGLRAASRACREAVAAHAWSDLDPDCRRSRIFGSAASWRACFPKARTANMMGNKTVTDADFALLEGIHSLNMAGCNQAIITDAAFAHLRGIDSLWMNYCNQVTITDAAFAHLRGIDALGMDGCNQATISDAAFAHLKGIHTLFMSGCNQITDAAMEHLRGISVLDIRGCPKIHAVSRKMLWRANKKIDLTFKEARD